MLSNPDFATRDLRDNQLTGFPVLPISINELTLAENELTMLSEADLMDFMSSNFIHSCVLVSVSNEILIIQAGSQQ